MQPGRSKADAKPKHLASINFPTELLEYLDDLATELDINRSSLVCRILQDFKESGRTVKLQITEK